MSRNETKGARAPARTVEDGRAGALRLASPPSVTRGDLMGKVFGRCRPYSFGPADSGWVRIELDLSRVRNGTTSR